MAFPALTPTARSYTPGDWPVKSFTSMSGVEIRLRYGDNRTGAKLQLSFDHIPDARAQEFLSHYAEVQGTFRSFVLPSSATTGWSGGALSPGTATTAAYRYSQPPQVTNIRPGVSSVSVELLGVM